MRILHILTLSLLTILTACQSTRQGLPILEDARALALPVGQRQGPAQVPVAISDDGKRIITTDDQFAGLFLTDFSTSTTTLITRGYNSGYYASFDPTARYVMFKAFLPDGEVPVVSATDEEWDLHAAKERTRLSALTGGEAATLLQAPMIYDSVTGNLLRLEEYGFLSGTPAISKSGRVAYGYEGELIIRNTPTGPVQRRLPLMTTPNVIEWSPDESSIVFPGFTEQLVAIDLDTEDRRTLTDGKGSYWGPRFSPDGSYVAFVTINGKVGHVDLLSLNMKVVGSGQAPAWVSNTEYVSFTHGGTARRWSVTEESKGVAVKEVGPRWWAVSPGGHFASQKGPVVAIDVYTPEGFKQVEKAIWRGQEDPAPPKYTAWPASMMDDGYNDPRELVYRREGPELTGVPYIHQVYDVPDWFNGHWACNAVSAIMCMAYWKAIEPSPVEVTRPSARLSNFGKYICEEYETPKKVFNIASPDPDAKPAKGGYGFIVREDWKDTKNYIAEYMRAHGVESNVDWSPTMEKVRAQIDAKRPVIILNSVTYAGHYFTAIGYLTEKGTVVVHDPYGNKNTRIYHEIDGRRARYDLPGWNNGYQNIRVFHCLITSEGLIGQPAQ